MRNTNIRPIITLTCLLVFMCLRALSPCSRYALCVVGGCLGRVLRTALDRRSDAGGHHYALIALHLQVEEVQGPRRRAVDEDSAFLGIGGAMAGAAGPAR